MISNGWPLATARSADSVPTAARSTSPASRAASAAGSPPGDTTVAFRPSAWKVFRARAAHTGRKLKEAKPWAMRTACWADAKVGSKDNVAASAAARGRLWIGRMLTPVRSAILDVGGRGCNRGFPAKQSPFQSSCDEIGGDHKRQQDDDSGEHARRIVGR